MSDPANADSSPPPRERRTGRGRRARAPQGLLRALGILGWDRLEPIVLAALATESPLLLVGPHGSAKTLLLARLAEALGLDHRHYNASLLNFDDLIGFPVPQEGRLVYLQTPSTIWDAASVCFDEVSRCRPDLQNKLFPLVYDRVVQGVPLPKLRHRWAAMNPPPRQDDRPGAGDSIHEYAGTEPLDVALADRFAFIVTVPSLGELNRADQLQLLRTQGQVAADAAPRLAQAVAAIAARLPAIDAELRPGAAEYVHVIAGKLATAGHPVSARRAVQLTRNIVAVRAAMAAADEQAVVEDAFVAAVRCSLPDAAWGRPPQPTTVLAAHKAAWEIAKLDADSALRRVLTEGNPLRRIGAALGLPVGSPEAGPVIADAFAMLPRPARLACAAVLMPRLAHRTDLPAATIEAVAQDYALVAEEGISTVDVLRYGQDWKREVLSGFVPTLDRSTERGRVLLNAAVALVVSNEPFEPSVLAAAYDDAAGALALARGKR